jgi:CelD/BcsL family acetyltransferase involved in cellulose biosynthesis
VNSDDLHALQPEWSALWEQCPAATPFASPEWLLPWHDYLFQGGELCTVAARREGRLTGLAPLFIYGTGDQPRTLSSLGTGVTDYLDFLLKPDETPDALSAIRREIESRPWDICDLQEIPAGSHLLDPIFTEGWRAERSFCETCAVVALPAEMAEFESRLSSKFRHNLRNSRNRLLDRGAAFETTAGAEDVEYVEALFQLHTRRWHTRAQSGMLSTAPLQSFFRAVVQGFQKRGWLRFHGLRYGGKLAAVMCVFHGASAGPLLSERLRRIAGAAQPGNRADRIRNRARHR